MIRSINRELDEDAIEGLVAEELDEREENVCFGYACGVAVRGCVGAAYGAGCFGIAFCAVGLHTYSF